MRYISIIVPIYNAGRYLKQCLNSILRQDFINIEVILVNDGSTDNSFKICQKYAKNDNRIIVIDKSHEGVEKARFTGYKSASGRYIMYIDSDDWLGNKNILGMMFEKAEETGADYVEINHVKCLDSFGLVKKKVRSKLSGLITQPELTDKYFISFFGKPEISLYVWGKLYRKSLLDKLSLTPIGLNSGEDVMYNMQIFPYLNKVYVIDSVGYYYRILGSTSRFDARLLFDSKKRYLLKCEFIKKYGIEEALLPVNRELKEMVKTDIQQRIRNNHSREEILNYLEMEIKDPVYKKLSDFYRCSESRNEVFFRALYAKEVKKMYELAFIAEKKNKWKRRLLKIFHF